MGNACVVAERLLKRKMGVRASRVCLIALTISLGLDNSDSVAKALKEERRAEPRSVLPLRGGLEGGILVSALRSRLGAVVSSAGGVSPKKASKSSRRRFDSCRRVVGVAQLARASGCGPERRGFESHHPPNDAQARRHAQWSLSGAIMPCNATYLRLSGIGYGRGRTGGASPG